MLVKFLVLVQHTTVGYILQTPAWRDKFYYTWDTCLANSVILKLYFKVLPQFNFMFAHLDVFMTYVINSIKLYNWRASG